MNPFGQAFLGQVMLAGSAIGQVFPTSEEWSFNELYAARYRAAVLKDWEAVRYYDYLIEQKWTEEYQAPVTPTSPPYVKYPCPPGAIPMYRGGLPGCEGRPDVTDPPIRRGPWGIPLPPVPSTTTPSRPFSPRNIPRGTQSPFSEEQGMVPSEDWRFASCPPGTQRMVRGGACVSPSLVSSALTMPSAAPIQYTLGRAFLGQVPIRKSGPF